MSSTNNAENAMKLAGNAMKMAGMISGYEYKFSVDAKRVPERFGKNIWGEEEMILCGTYFPIRVNINSPEIEYCKTHFFLCFSEDCLPLEVPVDMVNSFTCLGKTKNDYSLVLGKF